MRSKRLLFFRERNYAKFLNKNTTKQLLKIFIHKQKQPHYENIYLHHPK